MLSEGTGRTVKWAKGSLALSFLIHFHKFLRHWISLIKEKAKKHYLYRFDCFHAITLPYNSLHENLDDISCCLDLLCSDYLVAIQVFPIWSEPNVLDLHLPHLGLDRKNVKFPNYRIIRYHHTIVIG